jgi:hypothetical protein
MTNVAPYEDLFTRNIGFVDENEQALLRTVHVAVCGVGGMGGVVAQVLARSGVGRLTILDKDAFEPSNTNRQVYARTDTWGRAKAEVTAEELRKVNPEITIRVFDHFGADNVESVLEGVDVAVNGMDELAACLRLWRGARDRKIPLVDAWSAPLPNVFVVRPGDPIPEEFLGYPTREMSPDDVEVSRVNGNGPDAARAKAIVDECKLREAIHVVLHSRSLRYLDMQIIQEIMTGRRARISFAPMVWSAGLMMAWEAIKLRLARGDVAPYYGRFWDPWRGDLREARRLIPFEVDLVHRAMALFNRGS